MDTHILGHTQHACVSIYSAYSQPPTDSSYTRGHSYSHATGHAHTAHAQRIYHKDVGVHTHTHTLCPAPVSWCGHTTPSYPRPCLSTLVIMVNSWACYPIAAYGCLIALLGYIKTHDCTFGHVLQSLWSHTIFRLRTKASVFCLRSQDKNAV